MQVTDTSAIQRLIRRARGRIRGQWALEGATTATILAAPAALLAIFAMRVGWVARPVGWALVAAALGIVIAGALIKALRRIDDETVARRIDRASNLADRLSTAIAFARGGTDGNGGSGNGGNGDGDDGDETRDLMRAAIRDGVRAVPRADVALATPFAAPSDLRAAAVFLVISALAAGLAVPADERAPHLFRAEPDHIAAGDTTTLRGSHLDSAVPPLVFVGADRGHPAKVDDWAPDHLVVRVPGDTPVGATTLTAWIAGQAVGPIAITIVDRRDPAYHKEGSVELDPDDRAYIESIVKQLRMVAKRDNVQELDDFATKIEQLLKDAELGKISKEQLLDELSKAEAKLNENAEPNQAEVDKQLSELGKELAGDPLTKELSDALQKQDLDKARQALEKLAEKLDKNELTDKQKQDLAKKLDNKVVQQLAKPDAAPPEAKDPQSPDGQKQDGQKQDGQKQDGQKQDAQKQDGQKQDPKTGEQKQDGKRTEQMKKVEDEIRRLEKKQKDAKTDQERLDAERQIDKKKNELKKLEKDEQDKEQSAQRQALKRLSRDMEKAAENLQKPEPKDPKDGKDGKDGKQGDKGDKGEQEQRDRQASQKIKDAARETGRVDQDRRKQATQKKVSSQMDDLREAMRRAKQKGNKGGQDPFNKQGKNRDFAQRARGQRGSGQSWKPGQGGQGQGQGQGQGGNGQGQGQGQGQGGSEWGVGHDDNLTGDPTDKSGNTKDVDLQGTQGKEGGGTRETILSAAQKGFASEKYREVYGKYQATIEDVMRAEQLPSSYKYYVKKYFAKIHPTMTAEPSGDAQKDQTP